MASKLIATVTSPIVRQDAEISRFSDSAISFSIAASTYDRKTKERGSHFIEVTYFPRGDAQDQLKYFTKGQVVQVVGELEIRTYEARDGSVKVGLSMRALDADPFIAGRGEGESGGSRTGGGQYRSGNGRPPVRKAQQRQDDDLPFED